MCTSSLTIFFRISSCERVLGMFRFRVRHRFRDRLRPRPGFSPRHSLNTQRITTDLQQYSSRLPPPFRTPVATRHTHTIILRMRAKKKTKLVYHFVFVRAFKRFRSHTLLRAAQGRSSALAKPRINTLAYGNLGRPISETQGTGGNGKSTWHTNYFCLFCLLCPIYCGRLLSPLR